MTTEYVNSSIATESLREILKTMNTDNNKIWAITAVSSMEDMKDRKDLSIPQFGVKVYKGVKNKFSICYNYEKKNKKTHLQHDEITNIGKKKILGLLDVLNLIDVPVSDFTLLIESHELTETLIRYCGFKKKLNENSVNYIAKFVAEQCDGEHDRKKLESFEVNRMLLSQTNKFKHFVMNLKYLAEYGQHKSNGLRIINIAKNKYIETDNPYILAKTLKSIWGKYGMTKHFKKDKEDKLVLMKVS